MSGLLGFLGKKGRLDTDVVEPTAPTSDLGDKQAVELVVSRADEALKTRAALEGQWAVCLAFENSQQWVEWNKNSASLQSLIKTDTVQSRYRFRTYNLIRPIVLQLVANATRNKPASVFQPQNPQSSIDLMATEEARDLVGHYSAKFDDQSKLVSIARFAYIATTCFYKQTWDAGEWAYVPEGFDPETGEATSFVRAQVGDLVETVVPGPEILLDPKATKSDLSDCRWLIHAHVMPTAEVFERYKQRVPADAKEDQTAQRVGPFLATMLRSHQTSVSFTDKSIPDNTVLVYEMYEKRTPQLPNGRYIVCTRDRVLLNTPLPYECVDIPFIAVGVDPSPDSPYHRGRVEDLCPLNMDFNRTISRILERMEYDKLTLVVPKCAKLGADSHEEQRHMRRVYVEPEASFGSYNVSQPPPINPEWFTMLEVIRSSMQDIAGIHDVSRGQASGDASSGYAIRLLQDADVSQHSTFYQTIEAFVAERDRRRIGLCAEFYREPRQVSIPLTSQDVDPATGQPAIAVKQRTFEGLLSGGKTRVSVIPGSATPKSPEAHNQEIKELFQMGMFGPPGDPRASEMALALLKINDSDKIRDLMAKMVSENNEQMAQQAALSQLQTVAGASQAMMQGEASLNPPSKPETKGK